MKLVKLKRRCNIIIKITSIRLSHVYSLQVLKGRRDSIKNMYKKIHNTKKGYSVYQFCSV